MRNFAEWPKLKIGRQGRRQAVLSQESLIRRLRDAEAAAPCAAGLCVPHMLAYLEFRV